MTQFFAHNSQVQRMSSCCARFALLVMLSIVASQTGVASAVGKDVRVMSFNIRYGTARDGENHWDRRKDHLVDTIRAYDPDLLGTQETLAFQRDFIGDKLTGYDHFGVGRDFGDDRGEMAALFYKRDRFEKLDGGHFWLSDMPDKVGSKSWDSSLPRMVTWVKLRDRLHANATPLIFFNTHFDHQGATARLEAARLLRRQIEILGKDAFVVVTGDFNTGPGSPPYEALFGSADGKPAPVIDSFRAVNPDVTPSEGTFSSFKAANTGGARIDWIGVSRDWQIRSAGIDRTSRDGRTPSDHFPVTAILRRKTSDITFHPRSARDVVSAGPLFGGNFEVESIVDRPYYDGPGFNPAKHKLDLFLPKGVTGFPVLFFVHGGAWTVGDRKQYSLIGKVFARNGIGTAVISYRLSPGVKHPAHIEDVAHAFAWTRQHIAEYGGRADRIFVSGQSAGGHLAALLATDEKYLQSHGLKLKDIRGAIPISGIYSFGPGELKPIIGSDPAAAASASPLNHVSGDEPPFLILYADDDMPRCDVMSEKMAAALKSHNVQVDCYEVPHRNHLTIIFQPMLGDRDTTVQVMLRFIARHSELQLKPSRQ